MIIASGVRREVHLAKALNVHYDYDDHNCVKSRIRHRHETPSLCLIWHFKTERLTKLRKNSLNACNYDFFMILCRTG